MFYLFISVFFFLKHLIAIFTKVVKEELEKQIYILDNDLHPYYKKENFQSIACFEAWKSSTLSFLLKSIENFSHVQVLCSLDQTTESKYIDKLKSHMDYYERILNQIFKHLKAINRPNLTSNSKRLLREFQMRFLIVSLKNLFLIEPFLFDFSVFLQKKIEKKTNVCSLQPYRNRCNYSF